MSDAQTQDVLDKAVAEGGAYEVLQRRLQEQGQRLRSLTETLNGQRLAEFGSSAMEAIGRVRIRTENNCIARDIVQVGECLLFGYNEMCIRDSPHNRVSEVQRRQMTTILGDNIHNIAIEGNFDDCQELSLIHI